MSGVGEAGASDELVVVTGAAGGIGRVTCELFLDAGHPVVGVDLSATVSEPPSPGGRYTGIVADTCDEASMTGALSRLPWAVHHLVTCAGISLPEESRADSGHGVPTVDVFRRSVELNLTGHYVALNAVWPALRGGSGNRSVTFCSSINAMASYGQAAYSAAKAGLIGLARSLVVPLGAAGVRVNTVAPGTVPTPSTRREWAHVPAHFDNMAAQVPTGRLGEPADIAAAFLALARDLRHVSGHTLVVDGGQLRAR